MRISRVSLLALTLAAAPAFAGDMDLSLTNNSVKGQVNFLGPNDDVQLGGGYTYHEGSRHIANVDFRPGPHGRWQPPDHCRSRCARYRLG